MSPEVEKKYAAFISYNRGTSGPVAEHLQGRLQRYAGPWHHLRRARRVFRDESDARSGDTARKAVLDALDDSEWFVLLAGPGSARSDWVQEEINRWQAAHHDENGQVTNIILVLVDGELRWDRETQRFDPERSTAVRQELLRTFRDQPIWLDLRPRPGDDEATIEARLEQAVASITAAVEDVPLAEISGLHLRERRRSMAAMLAAASALAVLAVATTAFWVMAVRERDEARLQRDRALSRQIALRAGNLRDTDPALSRQLALVAYGISPTVEARGALLSSASMAPVTRMQDHAGEVWDNDVTDDGRTLATVGSDGVVRLWNVADPAHPRPEGRVDVHVAMFGVAFAPGGTLLAAGADDGTVRLWDVRDRARPRPVGGKLSGHAARVNAVAFTPDGTTLISGSSDRTVRRWDVRDPDHPRPSGPALKGNTASVTSVAVSADGAILVAGGDGVPRIWPMTDAPGALPAGTDSDRLSSISAVRFAPSGRTLAVGRADGSVELWDLSAPRHSERTKRWDTHTNAVYAVAFSGDGALLASGSNDNTVQVRSTTDGRVSTTLPHPQSIQAIAFLGSAGELAASGNDGPLRLWHLPGPVLGAGNDQLVSAVLSPDGRRLATGSVDGSARLWDVSRQDQARLLGPPDRQHAAAAGRMAFRPDGRLLAVPGADGTITLLEVEESGLRPAGPPIVVGSGPVTSATFALDGRLLVAGGRDGSLRRWNVSDPGDPRELLPPLRDREGGIFEVTADPAGHILAVAGGDTLTFLYEVDESGALRRLGDPLAGFRGAALAAAFSPDGRTLAIAGADGLVWVWTIAGGQRPAPAVRPLLNSGVPAIDITFLGPHRIATANADHSVWLLDIGAGSPALLARLTGHRDAVHAVSYDPVRDLLTTGSADGEAILWDLDTGRVSAEICGVVGDDLTREEWDTAEVGRPYAPPCR